MASGHVGVVVGVILPTKTGGVMVRVPVCLVPLSPAAVIRLLHIHAVPQHVEPDAVADRRSGASAGTEGPGIYGIVHADVGERAFHALG